MRCYLFSNTAILKIVGPIQFAVDSQVAVVTFPNSTTIRHKYPHNTQDISFILMS